MLDSRAKKRYEKLREAERKYRRYERPQSLGSSFFIVFVVGLIVADSLASYVFKVDIKGPLGLLVLVGLVIVVPLTLVLDRKAKVYKLDGDGWVMFYACSALENVQNLLESKQSGMREEYRKKAVQSNEGLLSMRAQWLYWPWVL